MKTIPRPYNLIVRNSLPEKEFKKNYGEDLFDKLKNEAFALDKGKCSGCGHEPPESIKDKCLFFHIYECDKKNPELSKGTTLCKMCHLTQHIYSAVDHGWVSFVNSTYSQNTIISITRSGGQIHNAIKQRAIVGLKKTPEQFTKEWMSGESKPSSTLKVIFNNNFVIDDMYD